MFIVVLWNDRPHKIFFDMLKKYKILFVIWSSIQKVTLNPVESLKTSIYNPKHTKNTKTHVQLISPFSKIIQQSILSPKTTFKEISILCWCLWHYWYCWEPHIFINSYFPYFGILGSPIFKPCLYIFVWFRIFITFILSFIFLYMLYMLYMTRPPLILWRNVAHFR